MYEIGSEFNYIEKEEARDLTAMYEGSGDVRLLRCGRDAIGYVCEDIKNIALARADAVNSHKEETSANCRGALRYVALLPALCCDSMYRPFEVHGAEVMFYGINEDLSVDTDSLKKIIDDICSQSEDKPVIMVLTAVYYGITDISSLNSFIRSIDDEIYVIEDVTQGVLAPSTFDTDNADYIIGSIRKWMGVPDGAVAIRNNKVINNHIKGQNLLDTDDDHISDGIVTDRFSIEPLKGENSFAAERSKALRMKTQYLQNGDKELKTRFRELLGHAEDTLTDGEDMYEISDESRRYLESVPVEKIVSTRNNNYDTLYELLEKSVHNNVYFKLFPKKKTGMPAFMLPVMIDTDRLNKYIADNTKNDNKKDDHISGNAGQESSCDKDHVIDRDGFERLLAGKGIYAPVLWPVSDEAAKVCPVSKDIADHILCFWIDQRYDRFDMVQTKECFEETINELLR